MATEVIMPALGIAQDTGKVLRWLKREGEDVVRGEPLVEIETDKVTVELEAPGDGTLSNVSAAEGEDVPVGRAIAFILAAGEAAPAAKAAAAPAVEAAPPPAPSGNGHARASRLRASPKARRIAQLNAVDLASVRGTGPHGAVLAADVLGALAGTQPAPAEGPRTTGAWRVMAERLSRSWAEVPQFTLRRDVDATGLVAWRAVCRDRGESTVTFTDLLVFAVSRLLPEHERLNGSWTGSDLVVHRDVNVGIAVATDDALIVPVIPRASTLSLAELTEARRAVVERARAGTLRPADVQDGTFTVSNLGMFGVDSFDAIVNPPQAAILAVGRMRDALALDGERVVSRPLLSLTLSCDHRAVDGARGARFLEALADALEQPLRLYV